MRIECGIIKDAALSSGAAKHFMSGKDNSRKTKMIMKEKTDQEVKLEKFAKPGCPILSPYLEALEDLAFKVSVG